MLVPLPEEDNLSEVIPLIFSLAAGRKVWLFYGPMGAGKTTFIKAICRYLGSSDNLSSPSFSIVNEYETGDGRLIYHFDFYRLEDSEEALDMGVEEYWSSGEYCFIEWPEKVGDLLPQGVFRIDILQEEGKRLLKLYT